MFGYQTTLKKRQFLFVNALYLLLVASVILIGNAEQPSIERVEGEEPTYTITLNGDNAPLSLSTDSFGTGTGTGRYVDFDYGNAKRVASYHAVFAEDGTISNNVDTRITSIKSITATFTGGEATLTTGWQASPTTNPQILTSTSPATFLSGPYFFMITNTGTGQLSLTSLVITYSCIPNGEVGGVTNFGMYPQTKVTDSTLISTLTSAAGTLPSSGNNQAWTDYDYYISGTVSSYMWYIDLVNESSEYRGVYFTSYRPYYTTYSSSAYYTYQDDNGYTAGNVYWFKYEPISWRVLDIQNDNAFLMANLVIDSQDYYYSTSNRTIDSATVYPNNYKESHIRSWLNYNFYNTAFTPEEKATIQTTIVDNSADSTGYNPNTYACVDTSDKVFLLSRVDVTNASYGLSADADRQLKTSAYAQSQGANTSSTFGHWFLRSPHSSLSDYNFRLTSQGNIDWRTIYHTSDGVVPALWISLDGKTNFGMYPQTKVTDSTLVSTLTSAAGSLPSSGNNQAWTDYGYYISGSISSFMWYIDLINGNEKYRGVYFTSYRPYQTTIPSSTGNTFQDDNGYTTSSVYWFKYEPIAWRVLDVQAGKAFLMTNLVLDSQDYFYSDSNRTINSVTVYPNNYMESHIRFWLNDNFYNAAFSAEEKARIQTTTVDNSVASTGYDPNIYACANTSDKVFLLSYVEATSATNGLSTTTSRKLAPSAYAKSQGVYTYTTGYNYWWLRSPSSSSVSARLVNRDGSFGGISVNYAYPGIVPALWISL
ncbi:MAG TPA: DUF6273 domain-containing protein [Bacilli bacterium]|nr:DUF6273 domain-containing protein [Bacilli bacterium]